MPCHLLRPRDKTYDVDNNRDRLYNIKKIKISTGAVISDINICDYDAMGNPCSYKGQAMTWVRGRMLKSCGGTSYEYNARGSRFKKTTGGVEHKYWYIYDRLIGEKRSNDTGSYMYLYDATGVAGIRYRLPLAQTQTIHYYQKNLQGDITHILDSTGAVVAKYVYDAWGNHRCISENGTVIYDSAVGVTAGYETHIGNINPFRYRSYYWDTETGLYYLQSRYYDPQDGRFINADEIDYLEPETLNGLNLYVYCGNNPVMRTDSQGNSWWSDFWQGFGIGFIKAGVAIYRFVMETIPDFFVNTVWNGLIVPAWEATAKFFSQTVPDFFVNTIWERGIKHYIWERGIKHYLWEQGIKKYIWDPILEPSMLNNGYQWMLWGNRILSLLYPIGARIARYNMASNNYKHNKILDETFGDDARRFGYGLDGKRYIIEQSWFADYKYGATSFADTGCEVIAIYNLLLSMNREENLSDLIYWFDRRNYLFGKLGTFTDHLEKFLKSRDIRYNLITNVTNLPQPPFTVGKQYIVTCWNSSTTVEHGAHGFFVKVFGDQATGQEKLVEFNGYAGETFEEMLDDWAFISLIEIL